MITNKNLDHLIKTLDESGLEIDKDSLKNQLQENPDGFDMQVTRMGKKELEDSTLFFRKSEKGNYFSTEILEKNFTYLANQLLDAEMDASVITKLRESMIKGLTEITLTQPKTVKNQKTVSDLHFTYYPANQYYYWNTYDFKLLERAHGDLSGIPQKVFIDNDKWTNNYSVSEMTSLLLGDTITKEFVSKEGSFYVQDRKMDFTIIDKHGNFEKKKVIPGGTTHQQAPYQQSEPPSTAKGQSPALKEESRLPRRNRKNDKKKGVTR